MTSVDGRGEASAPSRGVAPEKRTTANGSRHLEQIEGYFDKNAEEWSRLYRAAERVNDLVLTDRKDLAVAFACRSLPAGSRILDAGCGAGLTAVDLVRKGFWVHGVDISERMVELCRANLAQAGVAPDRFALSRSDVVQGALDDASFDGVVALGFLQYQPGELEALKALNRVLRPGGLLVVSGPVKWRLSNYFGFSRVYSSLRRRLSRRRAAAQAAPSGAKEVQVISLHSYRVARFRSLLHSSGFQMMGHRGHGFVNFAIIGESLSFQAQLRLHKMLSWLSRLLPIGRFANDLVVVAQKSAPSREASGRA